MTQNTSSLYVMPLLQVNSTPTEWRAILLGPHSDNKVRHGELAGINGATIPIDELARLTREAGCTLVIGQPGKNGEHNFVERFASLVWDRHDEIYEVCRDENIEAYDNYNRSCERLDAFLRHRLDEPAYREYRNLYLRLEGEALGPWVCIQHEALYMGGLRDGLALSRFLNPSTSKSPNA